MEEKSPYTYKREKQRFSIRKTKAWGACSVFLGTSILFLSAGTVARADTENPVSEPQSSSQPTQPTQPQSSSQPTQPTQPQSSSQPTQPTQNNAVKTETALTHVDKDNFTDYFSLKGSATYDAKTGIVTITPDQNNKVGNFSLTSKIDMNKSFTLTGQVNLGSDPNGADGIGFAFHNGNTTDVGNAGGNLGIGGLQDAIGFKLDTYFNPYQAPLSNKNGSEISSTDSDGFGWNGDSMNAPYGTFVDTENEEVATKDGIKVQRWWAKDVDGTSQALSKRDVNGQPHAFTVDYDGDTRTLTIKYTQTSGKILTWTTTISNSNQPMQPMAMIVSASTGAEKNLQQFELTSFDFQQAATVNVKYVDTTGHKLDQGTVNYPDGAYVNGHYTTKQLAIPNYTFIKMDDKSLDANGLLTHAGDNGTVIYVYAPNQEAAKVTYIDDTTGKTLSAKALTGYYGSTDPYRTGDTIADYEKQGYELVSDNYPTNGVVYNQDGTVQSFAVHLTHGTTQTSGNQTVNETIHYQGAGNQTPADHTAQVTFTRQVSTDAVTGEKTYGPWSADQSFAAVTSPTIKGYTADQAQIDKQTVNGDSKDLEFTVTYTKTPVVGGNVTAKYVDENGNPIADDVIASGNVGDPYSTTQKDVPGYTFKEVQGNPTGSFTDQDQTVTYVYTKNPATDNNGGTGLNQPGKPGNGTDTGNPSSNQPGNPSQPSNATNNGVINTSTNTGSKVNNGAVNSPELPQTGENNSQSQTMSFIGILLAMFGSLLGFLGIKKRRND
ncbi:hypothetical protein LMG22465_16810 [Lactobacillus helveticus]|uniref:lectin-like domain-containing protein n=1 Tax=Lactobacillus helveticus TaxID=1587 RepID=UPI001A0CC188|nr:MucBP domain-containing protein [Lactobacillus helveticus]GFP05668.1 hypothetical protein LMG22465_16810 [Lactobacillus helveticus]